MKNAAYLMKNTLVLASGSIIMRLMTLCLQVYTASKIDSESLGIFGLMQSAYMIFITLAVSGIRFCVTRVAAEEISRGRNIGGVMRASFLYATFFGMLSFGAMHLFSGYIANVWIGSSRAVYPLKIMALSLPLIPQGAVIEGYLTAKQKVNGFIIIEILGQILQIGTVFAALTIFSPGFSNPCTALAAGVLIDETITNTALFILYAVERERSECEKKRAGQKIIKTAFPLAVSSYMRTALSSLGHMIIPRGLRSAGMGAGGAFVTYGIIHQMALPVLMFPSALCTALGEILIPRLTEAQSAKSKTGINYIVNRALRIGAIFSFAVSGYMFFYSDLIGYTIYKSSEAGLYIKMLSPIVAVIYLDCVTDGCLKGLGKQLGCMVLNILEAALNIVMLLFLLPKWGIMGFIVTMYVKEIFNFAMSLRLLGGAAEVDIDYKNILAIIFSSVFAAAAQKIMTDTQSLAICTVIYLSVYCTLIYITSSISRDDLKWAAALCRGK